MKRIDAIRLLIKLIDKEPIIHANGMICRESFSIKDRPQNFYMLGSMGLASSIGLGVAMSLPEKKVIIFDGDGNLLMNLGILAMVGGLKVKNLVHIIFDNESYGSTGNQPTLSRQVRLERLARASGYKTVEKVSKENELESKFRRCLKGEGPSFLLIKIEQQESKGIPRVSLMPEEINRRFKYSISK